MSYENLLDTIRMNREQALEEKTSPPHQCPRCTGELEDGPNGQLHCRYDGWTDRK